MIMDLSDEQLDVWADNLRASMRMFGYTEAQIDHEHDHFVANARSLWERIIVADAPVADNMESECWTLRPNDKRRADHPFQPTEYIDYRGSYAHRFAFALFFLNWTYTMMERIALDTGLEVDHLCGRPFCVRPDHLMWTTISTNRARGGAATRGKPRRVRGAL